MKQKKNTTQQQIFEKNYLFEIYNEQFSETFYLKLKINFCVCVCFNRSSEKKNMNLFIPSACLSVCLVVDS